MADPVRDCVAHYHSSRLGPGCSTRLSCFSLLLQASQDLDRQLIKGDKAVVTLPGLEFEIPANTQKGVFTTVEGLLTTAADTLEEQQPVRRAIDPGMADTVGTCIDRIRAVATAEASALPARLIVDDITGNSFLENPKAPASDPALRATYYRRSREQMYRAGLNPEGGAAQEGGGYGDSDVSGTGTGAADAQELDGDTRLMRGSRAVTTADTKPGYKTGGQIRGQTDRAKATAQGTPGTGWESLVFDSSGSSTAKELMAFPSACPNCGVDARVKMCVTDVPHFKEVILMAMLCDECGFREVEVKGGGAIPPMGTRQVLFVGGEEAVMAARAARARAGTGTAGGGAGAGEEAPAEVVAAVMGQAETDEVEAAVARILRGSASSVAPGGGDLSVESAIKMDLGRDLIKSDTAKIEIPDVGLELQHGTLGGVYTTVEGLLDKIREQLDSSNPFQSGSFDSADAGKRTGIMAFLARMNRLARGLEPFELRVDDPMANSWVHSPY